MHKTYTCKLTHHKTNTHVTTKTGARKCPEVLPVSIHYPSNYSTACFSLLLPSKYAPLNLQYFLNNKRLNCQLSFARTENFKMKATSYPQNICECCIHWTVLLYYIGRMEYKLQTWGITVHAVVHTQKP